MKNIDIVIADNDTSPFSPSYRLPIVNEYIISNYKILYNDNKWKILSRIKN